MVIVEVARTSSAIAVATRGHKRQSPVLRSWLKARRGQITTENVPSGASTTSIVGS